VAIELEDRARGTLGAPCALLCIERERNKCF
jgi:hypothetical protein